MPESTKVMIVDDDPLIRQAARACLESMGAFTITECTLGQEAVDKYAEAKPQLILLDVLMPTMSGVMTYGKIRQLPDGKDVPIIFVTARAYTAQLKEYNSMGAAGVIAKPFDMPTFTRTVQCVLEKAAKGKPA